MLTPEALLAMDEATFRAEVLMPLLKSMGYRHVVLHHGGILEQGKDIVMWREDPPGSRTNLAVVAKAGKLTGQADGSRSSAAAVKFQIDQCFGSPFIEATTLNRVDVHQCIVAVPEQVSNETKTSILSALGPERSRYVAFWSGHALWEMIERYLGPRTVLSKIQQSAELLEDASPHHRVTAQLSAGKIVLGVQAKHPDADRLEPLIFRGKFAFPDNESGRAVREALEAHVRTGSPVTIGAEFIKEFEVPPIVRQFTGGTVGRLELFPQPSPETASVDLVFVTSDGVISSLSQIRLKGVSAGTDVATFVSADDAAPLKLTLQLRKKDRQGFVTFETRNEGCNVKPVLQLAYFQRAIAKGGSLSVSASEHGIALFGQEVPPNQAEALPDELIEFLENLVTIQTRTSHVVVVPPANPTVGDLIEAKRIAAVVTTGRSSDPVRGGALSVRPKDTISSPTFNGGGSILFRTVEEESTIIWGTKIPLGRVYRSVTGLKIDANGVERLRAAVGVDQPDQVDVNLVEAGENSGRSEAVFLAFVETAERERYEQLLVSQELMGAPLS